MSDLSLQPILALLGDPVSGNPSQYMFEKAFNHHDLDWRYLTLEVTAENLGDAVHGMKVLGFRGGNCADPHKEKIIEHLDCTTEMASMLNVVNVVFRKDNQLVGENTEGKAVLRALGELTNPTEKNVVIIGAGRVAVAVAVELAKAGTAKITVVDRNNRKIESLVELLESNFDIAVSSDNLETKYQIPDDSDVVVQTMQLEDDTTLPLGLGSLDGQTVVLDLMLGPLRTWLLRQAEQRGCKVINGLEIYLRQAAINFQLWTDVEPNLAVMREAVEEYLEL